MAKKINSKSKNKIPTHTKIIKKHFPTFYEKPIIATLILLVLIAAFWMMK